MTYVICISSSPYSFSPEYFFRPAFSSNMQLFRIQQATDLQGPYEARLVVNKLWPHHGDHPEDQVFGWFR